MLVFVTTVSSCEREKPLVHSLTEFSFIGGKGASFDIHGRVVTGRRGQSIFFRTGVVPIPFVQTEAGLLNINILKRRSYSEHAGRAAGRFLWARSKNILSSGSPNRNYLGFSLSALARRRALRTAIAQFPSQEDFSDDGLTVALFYESRRAKGIEGAVLYTRRSPVARRLDKMLESQGRTPLDYPVLFDSKSITERFSF